MKQLLFILLVLNSMSVFSQANKVSDVFEEAFVITLKGDTIRGSIKIPKTKKVELFQKIVFKDKGNKIKIYTPDKINGYYCNNYYYISAYHNEESCYFKVLSKGKVTLFQTFYEKFNGGVVNELEEFCVMEENSNGEFKVIDAKGIKRQLKDIFKSNKSLSQKITDQKEILLKAEVLETYFKEFNQSATSN
jgi:hypothetical protein